MFDDQGNLPPGFHDWTIAEAEERLVQAFPESETRTRIWTGYRRLCGKLLAIINECEHWIDGSFATAKPEPNDLDLMVIVDKKHLDALSDAEDSALRTLVTNRASYLAQLCDSYLLIRVRPSDAGHDDYVAYRTYWKGLFGFDREDHPKGIVRVHLNAME